MSEQVKATTAYERVERYFAHVDVSAIVPQADIEALLVDYTTIQARLAKRKGIA